MALCLKQQLGKYPRHSFKLVPSGTLVLLCPQGMLSVVVTANFLTRGAEDPQALWSGSHWVLTSNNGCVTLSTYAARKVLVQAGFIPPSYSTQLSHLSSMGSYPELLSLLIESRGGWRSTPWLSRGMSAHSGERHEPLGELSRNKLIFK